MRKSSQIFDIKGTPEPCQQLLGFDQNSLYAKFKTFDTKNKKFLSLRRPTSPPTSGSGFTSRCPLDSSWLHSLVVFNENQTIEFALKIRIDRCKKKCERVGFEWRFDGTEIPRKSSDLA